MNARTEMYDAFSAKLAGLMSEVDMTPVQRDRIFSNIMELIKIAAQNKNLPSELNPDETS